MTVEGAIGCPLRLAPGRNSFSFALWNCHHKQLSDSFFRIHFFNRFINKWQFRYAKIVVDGNSILLKILRPGMKKQSQKVDCEVFDCL